MRNGVVLAMVSVTALALACLGACSDDDGATPDGAQPGPDAGLLDANLNVDGGGDAGDLPSDGSTDAGKPVFNAEYADNLSQAQNLGTTLCPTALSQNFRTLILPWDLDDSFWVSCD